MDLSARTLEKHGLRRGAYDGANKRRFCLFERIGDGYEVRREYDSKKARDEAAIRFLRIKRGET